ncbi:MAG: MazG-like family protein [Bacillota bacterium]|nr:MazG-like family protein [Bacillota bacterium]
MDDDIIKNIRLIERLKYGILKWIAQLFRALYNGPEKMIHEALSELVIYCYILGSKIGISFTRLDQGVNDKARIYLKESESHEHGIPSEDVLLFLRYRESHKV